MKKLILLVTALLLSLSLWSQSTPAPLSPPDTVMTSFQSLFEGIDKIKWSKSPKNIYLAMFKSQEGIKTVAYFAPTGRWLQTKRYLYELPIAIEDAVYALYEYAELKQMIETETAKGKQYLIILDSGKVMAKIMMDEEAQVLKKEEKPKGEKKNP